MCVCLQKRKRNKKEKTAEKGMDKLPLQVVFFLNRYGRKYAEGLSENRKTAEGNEKGGQRQPQTQVVRGRTEKISPICHLQKSTAKALHSCRRKRKKRKHSAEERKKSALSESLGNGGEQNEIAADKQNGLHGIADGGGKDFCQREGAGLGRKSTGFLGVGSAEKPSEDTGQNGTRKRGKQKGISPEWHTEKTDTDCTDKEQRPGQIGKNKDMLCLVEREELFFIESGSDFRTHGVAGEDTEKKGESGNAVQTEKRTGKRTEDCPNPFCRADTQKNTAGGKKRK